MTFKTTSFILSFCAALFCLSHAHAHTQNASDKQSNNSKPYTDRVHTFKSAAIDLVNPKARKAKKGQNSAGFVTIQNHSKMPQDIVKATSPIANIVELHTSFEENGVHKMRPVEAISAPANGKVELKSGGFHIMLIDLKDDIDVGQFVPITLELASGQHIKATYMVTGCCGSCHGKSKK